jgi:prepilin-type N-terminal cleavage/methylation domain-containing protein
MGVLAHSDEKWIDRGQDARGKRADFTGLARMRRSDKPSQGFTLVELVVVIVVMAIVATIAVPQFGNASTRYRSELAARKLAADLNYIRSVAVTRSSDQQVLLDFTTSTYTLVGITDPDSGSASTVVNLTEEPYKSTLVSAFGFTLSDTSVTLTIDGYGMPDHSGTALIRTGVAESSIDLDPSTGKAVLQ